MRLVSDHVKCYKHNGVRLQSAIGYISLCGLADVIRAERDRKLEEARARRRANADDRLFAKAG